MASLGGVAFTLPTLNATPNPSPKDFKGLKLSFYDEQTGKRYLRLNYDQAVAERKKLSTQEANMPATKQATHWPMLAVFEAFIRLKKL